MTYNGSQRKDIRKAEKLARDADARRRLYIRTVMSTIDGREWMHELLGRCHIFHTPFVRGAPDSTSFNCGEQNLGLQLLAEVTTGSPNEYILMIYEASQKEALNDRHDSDDRSTAEQHSGGEGPGRDVEGPIDGEPAGYGDEDGDETGSYH